jgi:AcrR family transcriptional regulator
VRAKPSQHANDLTTRARLRDAAIRRFASDGFDSSVRDIAATAGVTAGLITHHFGSKQALREECDAEVLRRVRDIKGEAMSMAPSSAIALMATAEGFGDSFAYILRSVREGSSIGKAFLEHMVEDAMVYIADGVEKGMLRQSRDPDGQALVLVTHALGGMLLQLTLLDETDFSDGAGMLARLAARTTVPTLEIYAEGILTDSTLLDEYLKTMPDPPGER